MDSRFKHVASDPRFKPVHDNDLVIDANDKRFRNLALSSTVRNDVDPRGRTFNPKKILSNKLPKKVQLQSQDDSEEEDESYDGDDDADSDFEAIEEYVDMPENQTLVKNMNISMNKSSDCDSMKASEKFMKLMNLVKDDEVDYLRGLGTYDGSSSSDDDSSSDEEDTTQLHDWAELDKDAQWDVDGHEVEETERIAVCNLDWERITAEDIYMVLNSFAPLGGKVTKVSLHVSEFGKKRLAEEEIKGPTEIRALPLTNESDDKTSDYETIRKYHFNKLKYYYGVVECNSLDAAVTIYKAVDRTSFKNGGIVDLRYIPSDMTFDETPHSVCTGVTGSYKSKGNMEGYMDSNLTKARYSWDEDKERVKLLQRFADCETAKDDPLLAEFLASGESESSENEDDDKNDAFTSYFDPMEKRTKEDTVKIYRNLMTSLDTVDAFKETEDKLLKRGLERGKESDIEEDSEEEGYEHLSPFEKYLLKRKKKQKDYRKEKKEKENGGPRKPKESDWDIPDDLKNDPFFKEQLEIRRKEKLKQNEAERKEKDKQFAKVELDRQEREREAALLLLDDGGDDMHVDMREVVKEAKKEAIGGGKKKKVSRWKLSRQKAKEKRLAKEGVVLTNPGEETSNGNSLLPAAPCEAKDIFEDDRFSKITTNWKGSIERTHPEFAKHQTPFLENLMQEFINRQLKEVKKPIRVCDLMVTSINTEEKVNGDEDNKPKSNKRKLTNVEGERVPKKKLKKKK